MLTARRLITGCILALLTTRVAVAQRGNTCEVPAGVDSGLIDNRSGEQAVIFATTIELPGALGLSLRFGEVRLGPGSEVVITSLLDGGVGRMDATDLVRWRNGSPGFNGDALRVELDAAPGNGYRLVVEGVIGSVPLAEHDLEWRCEDVFLRGDVSADAEVDIADAAVYLSRFFLESFFRYDCEDAADADDNGRLELSDALYLLNFLFLPAPPLPAPLGSCGDDPTPDLLNLCYYRACD